MDVSWYLHDVCVQHWSSHRIHCIPYTLGVAHMLSTPVLAGDREAFAIGFAFWPLMGMSPCQYVVGCVVM